MSLFVAAVLLASAATAVPQCSWDKPGMRPFMGDVVASVDRYGDIPADVRARLQKRMAARQYDELVTIRRDAIVGKRQYDPQIRDMHFGAGRVCRTVTRAKWATNSQERGLVYCDSGECLLVPTVCRNLSRITRLNAVDSMTGRGPGELVGPLLRVAESAGDSPPTFAGAGLALAGDVGIGQALGLAGGGAGGAGGAEGPGAAPPLSPPPPGGSNYPTVQGTVGGITVFPPVSPAVPELPAAWLWLLGGAGVAAAARWRRRRAAVAVQVEPIP